MALTTHDRVVRARLLHRIGFGPRPGEYAKALGQPVTKVQQRLLVTSDRATDTDLQASPPPTLPALELQSLGDRAALNRARAAQEQQLILWWLQRLTTTNQPALERMVWFWHGHWATSNTKVRDAGFMLQQNETLRATALGPFTTQARALLVDPAMLIWLDGSGSRRGAPNENLGREFLELFALGIGNYTEDDVMAAARALTGWRVDRTTRTARFNPQTHDSGPLVLLGRTGSLSVDDVVAAAVSAPAFGQQLARRMWLRHISDTDATAAQQALLTTAATRDGAALLRTTAEILATTRGELPLVKSPVEWLVSVLRALDLTPQALPAATQRALLNDLRDLGQTPFLPPSVAGWTHGAGWLNAATAQARWQCTQRLVKHADLDWLVAGTNRADAIADRLGVPTWSTATRRALTSASATDAVMLACNAPEYLVGV